MLQKANTLVRYNYIFVAWTCFIKLCYFQITAILCWLKQKLHFQDQNNQYNNKIAVTNLYSLLKY
jgi:hypothetical protein